MANRTSCVALLLSCLSIAGCGTVANLVKSRPEQNGKTPFGGVRHDVACIKKSANGDSCCQPVPSTEQRRQVALGVFCAADLPFTLIGDVVTWPYTATYTYINQPVPVPPVIQPPPVIPGPLVNEALPVTQANTEGRPQTAP